VWEENATRDGRDGKVGGVERDFCHPTVAADMKQPADNDGQIARGVSGRATGDSGSAKTSGSAKW